MRILIVILLLSLAKSLSAQVQFSSLNDLLKYADQQSLVVQRGKIQQQAAREATSITKSSLLPKVNAFGTSDYYPIVPSMVVPAPLLGGQQGKFTSVQFGMPLVFSSGVELQVPVINFSLNEALKTSKLREQSALYKAEADKEVLHMQLIQLYYGHLFLQKLSVINSSNQQSLDELLRAMQLRFQNGIVDPADFNRLKKLTIDNKTAAIIYQQQLEENNSALHALLNIPDSINISIKDWLSSDIEVGIAQVIDETERLGFKAAQSQVTVARQQVNETMKAPLPKLNFTSRYTYQWQKNENSTVHFDAAVVGLRLDVPLFAGKLYQKQKQQANTVLDAAKNEEQQVQASLKQQTNEWQAKYNGAAKKIALLKQKFQLAEENLRIATLNLKEGIIEYDSFNNIYLEYNQAQVELFQNLADSIIYQLLLTKKI